MMRVYKALAKLYFALGEERELREGDAEIKALDERDKRLKEASNEK